MTGLAAASITALYGTATRTLSSRLGDEINVIDCGADPTGVLDSQPAFQTAVNQTLTANSETRRKIIVVPPGTYKIDSSIDLSALSSNNPQGQGIIRGDPGASFLTANFSGYVFDNDDVAAVLHDGVIEGLGIKNIHASGSGIRYLGMDTFEARNCLIECGLVGVRMGGRSTASGAITDTCFSGKVSNCRFVSAISPPPAASSGVLAGPETAVQNCSIVGWGNGIRCYGAGGYILGCRIEGNLVGINAGQDIDDGNFGAKGWVIGGGSSEANDRHITIRACTALLITSMTMQGSANAPSGQSISAIEYHSGNTIKIQCVNASSDNGWTTAALYIAAGNGNQGQPEMSIEDSSFESYSAAGGTFEGWEARNVKVGSSTNLDFSCAIARLPSIVYVPTGTLRLVTDAANNTRGTAVTNTSGSVAQNNGSTYSVMVWKNTDKNWYIV